MNALRKSFGPSKSHQSGVPAEPGILPDPTTVWSLPGVLPGVVLNDPIWTLHRLMGCQNVEGHMKNSNQVHFGP